MIEDYKSILIQLGFTQSQANLYLTLLKTGQTDAKTLSKHSKVPRQAVYRVLQELQEMGFVDKVIAPPYEFKPAPIRDSLSVFIRKRTEKFHALEEKAISSLQQVESNKEALLPKEKNRLIIVQGKERIIQLIKNKHDDAQQSIDIINNVNRWLDILDYCHENYKKNLKKGIKTRVIVEQPENEESLLKEVQFLLADPNFKLGLRRGSIKTNACIFDGKEAIINLDIGKTLKESPVIWTNHPSLIAMSQTHFKACWKSAKKFD